MGAGGGGGGGGYRMTVVAGAAAVPGGPGGRALVSLDTKLPLQPKRKIHILTGFQRWISSGGYPGG